MDERQKYDLKQSRREFARRYYFRNQGTCVIEHDNQPITLVTVTDSGSNPEAPAYGCPPDEAAILVLYKSVNPDDAGPEREWIRLPADKSQFGTYIVRYAEMVFDAGNPGGKKVKE